MQWPDEWVEVHIGKDPVFAAPYEYLYGLMQVVTQWQDPGQRSFALQLLALVHTPRNLPKATYDEYTKELASAAVWAVVGVNSPDACQHCIDTLQELVP